MDASSNDQSVLSYVGPVGMGKRRATIPQPHLHQAAPSVAAHSLVCSAQKTLARVIDILLLRKRQGGRCRVVSVVFSSYMFILLFFAAEVG
eukprot:4059910-Prymnesium_polylepis.1